MHSSAQVGVSTTNRLAAIVFACRISNGHDTTSHIPTAGRAIRTRRTAASSQKEVRMSYRFNTLDIIVGVGMTAIVFGALLLFVATAGSFQPITLQSAALDSFPNDRTGMTWLQPALGQAVVDQALLERRSNQSLAEGVAAWNRATMASHDLHALPGGPYGFVMRDAIAAPVAHVARVQGVMGRSIVNFTRRGVRSGVLSAAQPGTAYNTGMIQKTEAMGTRLDEMFAATWQATLGRAIVETFQKNSKRADAIQEQVGTAVVRLTQSQTASEAQQAANQQQLAGLVAAAIRTNALSDRLQLLAAIEFPQEEAVVPTAKAASWPTIPMGYLMVALFGLGAIFFTVLIVSAMARAAKAQADMKRDSARWVYRMAS
jgi:hypothetical protein